MPPEPPDPKVFTVRPDPFDQADRPYEPPLLSLPPRCPPNDRHTALIGEGGRLVRNQGMVPACTAVALAHLIDYQRLLQQPPPVAEGELPPPLPPVSARMLFEMAQAFDEFPDEQQQGSTLRGALRGFQHNGVCLAQGDPDQELSDRQWKLTVDRAKQARGIVLGTYARLNKKLLDHQAAVRQVGAVLVSAQIHSGWTRRAVQQGQGTIPFSGEDSTAGHAFLIVGYTEEGFLVLNSQGSSWGGWRDEADRRWKGVGHWLYEDWQQNLLDSWVIQLGVPLRREQFLSIGTLFGKNNKVNGTVNQGVNRIQVNGHYLHFNDGQMVNTGVFRNDLDSVQETARLLSPSDGGRRYRHLLLWVESGLDPIETMMGRAAVLVAHLKRQQPSVYPMAVIWRREVQQLTADLLEARARRLETRTGGNEVAQGVMLESFAKEFLPPIWRTFEGEAERGFHQRPEDPIQRGDGWKAMRLLLEAATEGVDPMDVHLVAHSSGVVWLAEMVRRLANYAPGDTDRVAELATPQQRRRRIRSVDLIAPLLTVEGLQSLLRDLWGEGPPEPANPYVPMALYQRLLELDRQERLGGFPGSFLELARRCFPLDGRDPVFGSYNPIAGHAATIPPLLSVATEGGLVQTVLITDSANRVEQGLECVRLDPVPDHAELVNDSRLLAHVLRRIGLDSEDRMQSASN